MAKYIFEEHKDWWWWVTPKSLMDKPVHRWCVFPHSFTSELVHALIDEWNLGCEDLILDPFAGAGTTILAAKEKGIPAKGYDLSPFAVLVTKAKIANLDVSRLEDAWEYLQKSLDSMKWDGPTKDYPDLVHKALPGKLLSAFDALDRGISNLSVSEVERDFFRLALLTTIPLYSCAVATGGWLKWIKKRSRLSSIPSAFRRRVDLMLGDLHKVDLPRHPQWHVTQADARMLPDNNGRYTAVITSPPYPNRHDYTRVFGIELMFGFLDWEETRHLRYQSFHSHPEAHPIRPEICEYKQPLKLAKALAKIRNQTKEPRIPNMLAGYFLDMYICLREIRRVCRSGARIASVVGNAQYYGESIPVDELTAEVGEQVGLTCDKLLVTRYRGNSAQQMGRYGRRPSRESIVLFKRNQIE